VGGILVLIGYAYVHGCYTLAIPIRSHPGEPEPASPLGLLLLCIAMFFTGCGGSAGLTAAVNAVAKSFSDKTRASMTGAVLAGFGLSAFTFSTAGHLVSGGDAGGLLLLLSLGTGVPLIVGSFVVKPYPPTNEKEYEPLGEEAEDLIDDVDVIDPISGEAYPGSRTASLELHRSRSPAPRGRHVAHASRSTSPSPSQKHARSSSISPLHLSHSPMDLACSVDFWLLFIILSLLCGTGLMYINNAGTVALALGRDGQLEYDLKKISAWQAKQVATISVWNCLGRILGGELVLRRSRR
jgi:MFS family permease